MGQIDLHGAGVDAQAPGDLAVRQLLHHRKQENLPLARGELHEGVLERLDLQPRLDHARRIRSLVDHVEEIVELRCAHAMAPCPHAIAGDIDGDAEKICLRALHFRGLGRAIEPQERVVQNLVGELGRAQRASELPGQAVVVGPHHAMQNTAFCMHATSCMRHSPPPPRCGRPQQDNVKL